MRPGPNHRPGTARRTLALLAACSALVGITPDSKTAPSAASSAARADSKTAPSAASSAAANSAAANSAPASQSLLRVGETEVSVAQVQAWIEALTPGDLPSKGSRAERARAVVEQHFVPEALLAEHARKTLLDSEAMRSARDVALVDALERRLAATIQIEPTRIAEFYAQHQDRYQEPEAVYLWRILVASEQDAKDIIAKVKDKRLGVYEWGNLARERSLDEATKHRDGSLGFVRADGSTDVTQVRVDPALYAAAKDLPDGALVPTPVAEGQRFAVVWRRGTRRAVTQSLQDETPHIRAILARRELAKRREALVAELRNQYVSDVDAAALEGIEYTLTADAAVKRTRPALGSHSASDPTPKPSDRGER